jgi:hypothetical protein
MVTATDIGLRELDHRSNDGIDVRLLWDPHADRVTVAVRDERSDESLELAVEAADALAAFHHPYAYTVDRQPARHTHTTSRTGADDEPPTYPETSRSA